MPPGQGTVKWKHDFLGKISLANSAQQRDGCHHRGNCPVRSIQMTASTTEEKGIAQATTLRKPKPTRKANVAKRGRQGAHATAKATTKARPTKHRSQLAKKAS